MEKINLLISASDMEYGEALGYALSNLHNSFQITVERNKDSIEDCIFIYDRNGEDYKIKLSEELLDEKLILDDIENKKSPWSIYKYETITEMMKAIKIICGNIRGKPILFHNTGKSQFVCGVSGVGGSGVSSILIGLGRELSRYRDKKVLYISFEDFECSKYYIDTQWNKREVNHYLYYFFKNLSGNHNLPLDSFLNQDSYGLNLFTPSLSHNDLTELNIKEIDMLFSYISEFEDFDYILLDLQLNVKDEILHLMDWCSKIILISEETPVAKGKTDALYKYLTSDFLRHDMEKFIRIKNKCNVEEYADIDLNVINITLDMGSFCKKDNCTDISIENSFGLGVKEIGRKIIGS